MALSNLKNSLVLLFLIVPLASSCGILGFSNESLDEYSDKVRVTMATLVTYIGKSGEEVKRNFNEPTEIKRESGVIATHYQVEKVPFDEIWYYIYRKGIPGINADGSTKRFFLFEGTVVSVDAF